MNSASHRQIRFRVVSLALCLAGFGAAMPAMAQSSDAGRSAFVAAGKIMFEHRCRSCHAEARDQVSYGPSLIGIIGRKAGALPDFEYSDAMKTAGHIWDDATLRAWMENNTAFMPKTRMRHVAVADKAEQDFILAYLRKLSEN